MVVRSPLIADTSRLPVRNCAADADVANPPAVLWGIVRGALEKPVQRLTPVRSPEPEALKRQPKARSPKPTELTPMAADLLSRSPRCDMHVRNLSFVLVISGLSVASAGCGGDDLPTQPTPVCSYTIAPAATSFAPEGGTGSVSVTAETACAWNAGASAPWIGITAGSSGTGSGTVAYSVAANGGTEPRTGTLTIGGQVHTVTQQGRPATVCRYDLAPGSAEFGKDESGGTFAVTAPADCAWTASSNAGWLVVTAGAQGTGNGSVSYTVARNAEIAERTAGIAVADRTFTVRQAGDASICQYSVAPVDFSPCMPAGSATTTLTTQAGCSWTVTSNAPWLTIPSGSSGTGSAAITLAFSENYDAPRDGIAMVRWPTPTAGQNVRIAQAGCLYAVSRSTFTFTSAAATGTFDVIQQSQPNTCGGATQDRCIWSAVADVPWITITGSMPRSGDNPVAFAVAANDGTASRVGRITVRDKVVVISQAGR
jgi:Viral BACON domain/Putative binding domain, N-terminal